MKLFLLTLLVVLVCSTQVHTLKCFVCDGEEGCESSVDCEPGTTHCKISWTENSVSRSCSADCKNGDYMQCCTEEECNH